jgi:hypothetical protein
MVYVVVVVVVVVVTAAAVIGGSSGRVFASCCYVTLVCKVPSYRYRGIKGD